MRSHAPRDCHRAAAFSTLEPAQPQQGSFVVQGAEKRSSKTMLVSWSDATRGHFADQPWICAKSPRKALCVMTGDVIREHDSVYKPQLRGLRCKTVGSRMILAAALERVAEQEARKFSS
jgi:hypothetical protein